MKKILFFVFFVLFFSILLLPSQVSAYSDEEEVCYAQCATYKFVWQGDYCYDLFQQQCAMGEGKSIKETIKFLKSIYDVLKSGSGVDNVFKAWFVCKPLIENCIVPQLRECRNTCSEDDLFYAANLSVGHPYASFNYRGVVYNERDQTLTFKVVNYGRAYAWDIGVTAVWGHTRDRDGQVSGGGQLFSETIPELIFAGARIGPPKTVSDHVFDFLIEESNFTKYLQDFKSDADNYEVPIFWYKTIPFVPPEGELTKVIFNVDPNKMIRESNELNNTFVLTIDKLPTPPSFRIAELSQQLEHNTLNNFAIDFRIENTGEENGEVSVKIFEGKYKNASQSAIYSSTQVVQGLNRFNFNTYIAPDISADNITCGQFKYYELVVFDQGKKVDSREFSLPLYFGSVRGSVKDLFGNKVEGAVVTASSGQSTTVSKYGAYNLKNINQLGKVTITVSHPEFSKTETKELNFLMDDPLTYCEEGFLTFTSVNFVLKDLDVMFDITIKDRSGNLINAHVLAANEDWRFSESINGSGPLPGMQPGKYFFTISAPGYKTIGQDVNAVPNQQHLEFIMEPLAGRQTDGGLSTHQPQLLWQMDRGEEVVAKITATKDGKLVIIYTVNMGDTNYNSSGKIYFIDSLTGNVVKAVPTINTGTHEANSCLDTSYDGNTTALYLKKHGNFSKFDNSLKLFDSSGKQFVHQDIEPHSARECDVSPDGFYVYPFRLMNKGLYTYSKQEMFDIKNATSPATYAGLLHFTAANNIVVSCQKHEGQCLETLYKEEITDFGTINGDPRKIDSSQDENSVAMITVFKAYLFRNGSRAWEKEVIAGGDPLDISVSPGGQYVIYSTNRENIPHRTFQIFTANNLDKKIGDIGRSEDVIFVHANDKGIFYATNEQKTIKYYQVGSYSLDYNPDDLPPTESGQETTYNISYYDNGVWRGMGEVNFHQLYPGRVYMANSNITLQVMEPWGKLSILEGTIFGTDNYLNPVLLKGQITANFKSAFKIYAIKFDRFEMDLFVQKLADFTAGNLAQAEYFMVKNIHTKFIVSNYENKFKVAVASGEVELVGKEINEKIQGGRQISIDQDNNLKKLIYFGWKIYPIIVFLFLLIFAIVLFIYRKTPIAKKIIKIIKKIFIFIKNKISKN